MNFLLVMLGGFFGSIFRFYIASRISGVLGTWTANITGSLLLAVLVRFYMDEVLAEWIWLIAGVGFCGAYTTFSTFGNETVQHLLDGKRWKAAGYVGTSVAISMLVVLVVLEL